MIGKLGKAGRSAKNEKPRGTRKAVLVAQQEQDPNSPNSPDTPDAVSGPGAGAASLDRIRDQYVICGLHAIRVDDRIWDEIKSGPVKVLTADPDDSYFLMAQLRSKVALLQDMTLLVVDDEDKTRYVSYIVGLKPGNKISKVYIASPEQIREVYSRHEREVAREEANPETQYRRETWSAAEQDLIKIFKEAAETRASDIHFTFKPGEALLRYRVDGKMEHIRSYSVADVEEIFNIAHYSCDDTEGGHRIANSYQLGRIAGLRIEIPATVDSIRLQFNPLANAGQYAIFRLLYRDTVGANMDLDRLGYASFQMDAVHRMRQNPSGMVIISGITGSGKSTTLQKSLLALLSERGNGINIITIENPPEYHIPGAWQLPVTAGDTSQEGANVGFGRAIKAALRSDPDVIMIGEIRDPDSADLGVEAVRTGHQVWATLHAVSAVHSLKRMVGLKIPIGDISSTDMVNGLIAQRLIPRLCPGCSLGWEEAVRKGMFGNLPRAETVYENLFREADATEMLHDCVRGRNPDTPVTGCGNYEGCRSGYVGRSVVAECLVPDNEFFQIYLEGKDLGPQRAEEHWLRTGGVLMGEHCLVKALCGTVDAADMFVSVGIRESSQTPERMEALLGLAKEERQSQEDLERMLALESQNESG